MDAGRKSESDNAPYVGLICTACGKRVKLGDGKGWAEVHRNGKATYYAAHWPGKCPSA